MMIDSGKLKARAKDMRFQSAAEIIRVIEEEEHGNCGHSVHCDPNRDCDWGRYREAEDMSELLSREKVLMYLSDVQLSIAPTERDEGAEHEAHEYAYTVLEWVMESLKSMPGEKPNVQVLEKDADCISRQAAIEKAEKIVGGHAGYKAWAIIQMLRDLPEPEEGGTEADEQ